MSKLEPQYLFKDKEHHNPSALSDYDTLDFISNDQHVYGEIMWPDRALILSALFEVTQR